MNYKTPLFLILLAGVISISATPRSSTEGKTELILGKWVSYKIVEHGKTKHINTEHASMWMRFEENFRATVGVNDEAETQAEWAIEEEQKKLYITADGEQVEYDILKLTASALIIKRRNDPNKTKIFFNRSSE